MTGTTCSSVHPAHHGGQLLCSSIQSACQRLNQHACAIIALSSQNNAVLLTGICRASATTDALRHSKNGRVAGSVGASTRQQDTWQPSMLVWDFHQRCMQHEKPACIHKEDPCVQSQEPLVVSPCISRAADPTTSLALAAQDDSYSLKHVSAQRGLCSSNYMIR